MKKKTRRRLLFILLFLLLAAAEVAIGLYLHDDFIRPYVGDVLIAMALYALVRCFAPEKLSGLAVFIFLLLAAVEFTQMIPLVDYLGIENKIVRTMMGTSFSWWDLAAYAVGCLLFVPYDVRMRKEKDAFRKADKGIQNVYLVDFENVNESGLEGMGTLTPVNSVTIFHSDNTRSLPFDRGIELVKTKAEVKFMKTQRAGKNYLDFQLVTYLGYLIGSGFKGHIIIVTKDNGFNAVVDFWTARGFNVSRQPAIVPRQPHDGEKQEDAPKSGSSRRGRGQKRGGAGKDSAQKPAVSQDVEGMTEKKETPKTGRAPKKENTPKAEKTLKKEGAPKKENEPKAERAPKKENAPKAEKTLKKEEAPKKENAPKAERAPKPVKPVIKAAAQVITEPVKAAEKAAPIVEILADPDEEEETLEEVIPAAESLKENEKPVELLKKAETAAENMKTEEKQVEQLEKTETVVESPKPVSDGPKITVTKKSVETFVHQVEPEKTPVHQVNLEKTLVETVKKEASEGSPVIEEAAANLPAAEQKPAKKKPAKKKDKPAEQIAEAAESAAAAVAEKPAAKKNAGKAAAKKEKPAEQVNTEETAKEKKTLAEGVKKKVRAAVKEDELSPALYAQIYRALTESSTKNELNNALVKTFGNEKGSIVYGHVKAIFGEIHEED